MSWEFVRFICFWLVVVVEGVELYADILGWVEYNNWGCRGCLLLLSRLEHPILVSPLVAKRKEPQIKIEKPTPPNNYHLFTLPLPCWPCHKFFLWQRSRRKTVNQSDQTSSWGKTKSRTPLAFRILDVPTRTEEEDDLYTFNCSIQPIPWCQHTTLHLQQQ